MSIGRRLPHITLTAAVIAGTLPFSLGARATSAAAEGPGWISALDSVRVERSGTWHDHRFRYAQTTCLSTRETGAALTFEFTGSGVALGLGQLRVPAYGGPRLGKVIVTVDDGSPRVLYPAEEGRRWCWPGGCPMAGTRSGWPTNPRPGRRAALSPGSESWGRTREISPSISTARRTPSSWTPVRWCAAAARWSGTCWCETG